MSIARFLTACVLSVILIVGGVRVRALAAPAPEPEKKDDQKKDDKGSGDKKPQNPFGPDIDDLFKRLDGRGAMTPEQMDQLRKQLQKALEDMQKQFPGGLPGGGLPGGLPGLPGGVPFPNIMPLQPGLRLGERAASREN